MRKCLLISEVFPPRQGGSGRWFWELYRRLPREAVTIAAGEVPGDAEFDRGHDLRLARVPLSLPNWGVTSPRGLLGYLRAARQVGGMVKREKPDVLHCGRCLPEGLIGWMIQRRHGLPYACFVHGEEMTLARTSRELRWLTNRVLRRASFLVANSHHTRSILETQWNVDPERIRVLHPGVDTTRFQPAPRSSEVRARLGWHERPVILTVGALQKRKGQDMMIRALPEIRRAVPDVLYSIAGEGWERPYLEGLVDELGLRAHVQFRGVPGDDELLQCYQQCDLFALPNRQVGWDFEGFGIVLLEAQACGKPVIAGNSGGTGETLLDGETGWIVDCRSEEPLAQAVLRAIQDLPRRLHIQAVARDWVQSRFSWATVADTARSLLFGQHLDDSYSSRGEPKAATRETSLTR